MSQGDMNKKRQVIGGNNFLVSIHYQENQSWQGVVQWLDSGQKVNFRSALELISLIQDAINVEVDNKNAHRIWDTKGEMVQKETI